MDSKLQIISGAYRGRKLRLPPNARPTQNRARIALFNMLESGIVDFNQNLSVWDAFAGYLESGKFDTKGESGLVENDDFVPLGYTLGAVLLCALILWLMRKRKS